MRASFRVSLIIIGAMLCSVYGYGQSLDANGFGYKPPPLLPEQKLTLWSTYYYVHEAKYDESGISLNDKNGDPTGVRLASCDWCDAAVEGTVRTFDKNGKAITLNYAKAGTELQCDCQASCPKYASYGNKKIGYTLWAPARGEYGDGVSGYKLVPYRTIAVDRTFIPIGTLIYIPAAVGVIVTLPSGDKARHDGYFFAADVGGDIKSNHIDTFFGLKAKNPFDHITSVAEGTFDAYIVKGSSVETELKLLHR
ncbi:MAG: hypothetical protein KF736_13765 [Acidobacteria bacterium]|nr:hypothetical protein [Acidobacteriota bacterium]MCW5949664.1 hypothetical protein [Pyrinomonadaceae bacterium]